jgi:hypothetical protein
MINFLQAPFDLDAGDFLIARVRVLADNLYWSGNSFFSSGADNLLVKVVPQNKPSKLILGSKTSPSNVHIQWDAIPASDGPSIDYRVYWNSGPQNDDWKILTETTSGLT